MDTHDLLRLAAALVFTLALIGICAVIARRMFGKVPGFGVGRGGSDQVRLGAVEWRPLDGRHRLCLIRRDDREHLVILSSHAPPVVVEQGILRREEVQSRVPPPLVSTSPAPLPLGPASRG